MATTNFVSCLSPVFIFLSGFVMFRELLFMLLISISTGVVCSHVLKYVLCHSRVLLRAARQASFVACAAVIIRW